MTAEEQKLKAEFREYAMLVKEIRDKQTEYFRTRNKEVLIQSKALEKKLDQRTKEVLND
jgi:hypothetical protein